MAETLPVAVLGSGFAGTILARALQARGRPVVVLERATHPRFALGESSTPLAAIALERLAADYALPDLRALAAYGRWRRELPDVRHGLKRGFSFYAHRPGEPFRNGPENDHRLLVAASPDDEIADSHWMRADVDHHLVRRARSEGVPVHEGFEITDLEREGSGWRIRGRTASNAVSVDASFLVDATGAAGLVCRLLTAAGEIPGPGAPERPGRATRPAGRPDGGEAATKPSTGLVFAHFDGTRPLEACTRDAWLEDAPYPEGRAAVHHLIDEGWVYVLPFDGGRVSAGLVLDRTHPDVPELLDGRPLDAWTAIVARYPTLASLFAGAVPVGGLRTVPRLQRRAHVAAGRGFALLPHTFAFTSPMFSTGIAWSLVAVERLARILGTNGPEAEGAARDRLGAYAELLAREADHVGRIVTPAYGLRRDFAAFAAWSCVYFAAASFAEAHQRLADPPSQGHPSDAGFLGTGDPALEASIREVEGALRSGRGVDPGRAAASALASRDVIGLESLAATRTLGVDLEALVARAGRLGLSEETVTSRLPRLRGEPSRPNV